MEAKKKAMYHYLENTCLLSVKMKVDGDMDMNIAFLLAYTIFSVLHPLTNLFMIMLKMLLQIILNITVSLCQISNHLELIKPNPKDDPEKQVKDAKFAAAVYSPDIDLVGGSMQNESFLSLSDTKHCGKMRALEIVMVFKWRQSSFV
jgi:hypothetical protein